MPWTSPSRSPNTVISSSHSAFVPHLFHSLYLPFQVLLLKALILSFLAHQVLSSFRYSFLLSSQKFQSWFSVFELNLLYQLSLRSHCFHDNSRNLWQVQIWSFFSQLKKKVTISLAEKHVCKISVHNMEDQSLKKWSFFNNNYEFVINSKATYFLILRNGQSIFLETSWSKVASRQTPGRGNWSKDS